MDTSTAELLAIDDVVRASRLSRSGIFLAMQRGDLIARKYGRRTLITRADFEAFKDAMSVRQPKKTA